ncbi:DUF1491 family protein [Altericroceibacterium xinjiangense]|uniref:DUF1491 family protein n=1 Tax=Altericroceibacterium xinjiangense TaxID=762261 RepID=UPI000F7F105B|nr:DUF1491 family protein [Altericroceibacterium xinjiangense]
MSERLPAHLEAAGLIRSVEAAGGFAVVLAKGERDAGTILVVCLENGANARLYERMPQRDGTRSWVLARSEDPENPLDFSEYCQRRKRQDPDLWIIELDIANAEQFIDGLGTSG